MIEPTESESMETLNKFSECMIEIDSRIDTDPDSIINSPTKTPVRRLNETLANRELNVRYLDDL